MEFVQVLFIATYLIVGCVGFGPDAEIVPQAEVVPEAEIVPQAVASSDSSDDVAVSVTVVKDPADPCYGCTKIQTHPASIQCTSMLPSIGQFASSWFTAEKPLPPHCQGCANIPVVRVPSSGSSTCVDPNARVEVDGNVVTVTIEEYLMVNTENCQTAKLTGGGGCATIYEAYPDGYAATYLFPMVEVQEALEIARDSANPEEIELIIEIPLAISATIMGMRVVDYKQQGDRGAKLKGLSEYATSYTVVCIDGWCIAGEQEESAEGSGRRLDEQQDAYEEWLETQEVSAGSKPGLYAAVLYICIMFSAAVLSR